MLRVGGGGRRRCRRAEADRLARRAGKQFLPARGVLSVEPSRHRQVFVGRPDRTSPTKSASNERSTWRGASSRTASIGEVGSKDINFYPVSLSCRTLVYKGMFLSYQLGEYYPDLHHPRFASALALVHQRFSTNTFPSWRLAHPYRMIRHNGEINTLRGNVNWMAARQASVSSPLFGDDISKLWPMSYEGQSDTACFDNALEFLVQGGYSLAACDDDADPRGLGRQCRSWMQSAAPFTNIMPASWSRGTARLPWPSPTAARSAPRSTATACAPRAILVTDDGLVDHGVGNRRAARAGGEHRPEMAAAAGQDAAHRPRKGAHRLRRRDQGRARRRPSLSAMARPHPDPRA